MPCGSFHIQSFASEDDDFYVIFYQSLSRDIPFAPRMTRHSPRYTRKEPTRSAGVPPEGVLPRFSASSWYHLHHTAAARYPFRSCARPLTAGRNLLQGR